MDKKSKALLHFESGFSCSQAVFLPFAEEMGMDKEQALKIATPFGGGIGGTGDVCGAVSGAILAIGLKHGRATLEDTEAKTKSYEMAALFLDTFEKKHGSRQCKGLLGYDFSIPGQRAEAMEKGITKEKCPAFVRDAVEILEEIL